MSEAFNPPIDDEAGPGMSPLQAASLEDERTGPAETTDQTCDIDPSLDNLPGMKVLSITNNGSLTLHYHSYPANPSSPSSPSSLSGSAIVSRKRALQETEDEQHSEALASLTDCDNLTTSVPNAEPPAKRPKTEQSTSNMVNGNTIQPDLEMLEQADDQDVRPEAQSLPDGKAKKKADGKNTANNVGKKTGKKAGLVKKCTRCGMDYKKNANRGSKTPCCYHPGMYKRDERQLRPRIIDPRLIAITLTDEHHRHCRGVSSGSTQIEGQRETSSLCGMGLLSEGS